MSRSSSVRVAPLALALLASTCSLAHGQAPRARATEPLVVDVEVLDLDRTPVIPCGILGAQPRDVTARVLSVGTGTFSGERILLRWPMCELSQGFVGGRYRIHLRRWADAPTTPEMRYRVRRAVAIGSVFRPETQLAR